mmetsp:Transcript_7318/g.22139  ORF Transcript_7318/g.22139 Transcript_7318/m.22139 type:complete len:217 (+) Transcript_7318:773-1423(+)
MVFLGRPMLGAQATSRTQSECPLSVCSRAHSAPAVGCVHTLSVLSQPAVTSRRTGASPSATPTSAPGEAAGAQLTASAPRLCARASFLTSHSPVSLQLATAHEPSLEADASASPHSCGAHATPLTLASCVPSGSAHACCHARPCDPSCSRHTITLPSYPQDASSDPNLGCAHATRQTGCSWPARSARCWCVGACGVPDTWNTLTSRSLLHVASRVP